MAEISELVQVDDVLTPDGRVFSWLKSILYLREDGRETGVLVWQSTCCLCGESFAMTTLLDYSASKSFARKRCDRHVKGGKLVMKVQHGR